MNDILKIWHSPDGESSLYISCTHRKKSLFTDPNDSTAHLPRKQSVMITSVTFPQMEFNTQSTADDKLVSKHQNAAAQFSKFYSSLADTFIQNSIDSIGKYALDEAQRLSSARGVMAMYTLRRFECRCIFSPTLITDENLNEPRVEVNRNTLLLQGGNTLFESRDTLIWQLSDGMWECSLKVQ